MLNLKPFKSSPMHCGQGVLKMVLSYYGIEKEEQELAKELKWNEKDGVTAQNIIKTARRYGLEGFIKDNSSIEDIRHYVLEKKIPVIVEWFLEDDGHFCVVVDIDKDNIYLMEPCKGYKPNIRPVPLFDAGLPYFQKVWFTFEGAYMKTKNDLILRRMVVLQKK